MSSLTPFIRHEMDDMPGGTAAPGQASSRYSPPLGGEVAPPSQPDSPEVQLPPPLVPTQQREPAEPESVPVTDGTPLPCRQKNAAEYLRGASSPVMTQYAPGLFSTRQRTHSAHPAPEGDEAAVLGLVEWREESPYG